MNVNFQTVFVPLQDDELEPLQVKFGQEVLVLDSWLRRKQYYALCHILGPGLNTHLTENELLRDIFELGARIIDNLPSVKQTKLERVSCRGVPKFLICNFAFLSIF